MKRHGMELCLIGLSLAAATLFSGCETIMQDIRGVSASLKPVTPSEAARMMMDPHNADNRREGTTLIANAPWGGSDVYVTSYRDKVLHESDPIARAVAIRALARHGQPEDALRIMPHLTDTNVQVRWEAAKGLQRLHNPAVVPELLKVLRDDQERSDVRVAAAIALGQYPEDRVVQGLVAALDARELAVNSAADDSLMTLTGQSFDMDSHAWLHWYNSAAPAGVAFAAQREYLYPTYYRPDFWWEKVMFWTSRNFEQPAPPAGLRPRSIRETYDEEG